MKHRFVKIFEFPAAHDPAIIYQLLVTLEYDEEKDMPQLRFATRNEWGTDGAFAVSFNNDGEGYAKRQKAFDEIDQRGALEAFEPLMNLTNRVSKKEGKP